MKENEFTRLCRDYGLDEQETTDAWDDLRRSPYQGANDHESIVIVMRHLAKKDIKYLRGLMRADADEVVEKYGALLAGLEKSVGVGSSEAIKLIGTLRETIMLADANMRRQVEQASAAVAAMADDAARMAAARIEVEQVKVIGDVGKVMAKHVAEPSKAAVNTLALECQLATDTYKHAVTDGVAAIRTASSNAFRRRTTWRSEIYAAAGVLALGIALAAVAGAAVNQRMTDAAPDKNSSAYWGVQLTNKDASYWSSFVHWNPEISNIVNSNCTGSAVRRIGGRLVCSIPLWFEKPSEPSSVGLETSTSQSLAYNLEGVGELLHRQDPWLLILLGMLIGPLGRWAYNSNIGRFFFYGRRREEDAE